MAADPGLLSWKCYDCNMTFGNPRLLQKHKARFCVGGQIGDPDLLLLRRGLWDEERPPAKDPPDDYERLREGGRRQDPVPFVPRRRTRKPMFSRMTDNTSDIPRYNPSQDPKVQQLAESHGRQMEFLQNKNRDLERQREEIRRRLEELGRRPAEKDSSTEELLRELREQEARNQRLLDELRRQLAEARRPINVIKSDPEKRSFIYPVYYGNSLVAEIVAVRQAYLQNGGNDPDILAQLAQMQAEAQAIDDSMRNAQKRQPKDKKDGSSNLTMLELENERLQRQLLLLQEQKLISTNRRKDNREGRAAPTIRPAHSQKAPASQKPPTTRQSMNKWVQTNPVPSEEAETSALPPANDYAVQRKHAKLALEDRWGASRRKQMTSSTAQTQPQGRGRRGGRAVNPGDPGNQRTQDQPDTYESLKPEKLETIEEAANVDFYDPDQPLDVNLSAIPPRKNRVLYPYKPDIGPQRNTSRVVIVRSERPYGWVDFYGRPVDRNGRLLEDLDQKKRLRLSRSRFPYYNTYQTGQRLFLYEHALQDLFRRSEDLLHYDPYYLSTYSKRRRYAKDLEESEAAEGNTPCQPAHLSLVLDYERGAPTSDNLPLQPLQENSQVPETSRTSNAEVQTDPRDFHESEQGTDKRRPPPPTQKPGKGSSQGAQPAANPAGQNSSPQGPEGVDKEQVDPNSKGKGKGKSTVK